MGQLHGSKRFVLFSPLAGAEALAPFPLVHPRDRSARIRLDNPDVVAWPSVSRAKGRALEVTLNPGDVLFLPSGWWHHVESLSDMNVSVNFWFESSAFTDANSSVQRSLSECGLLELARCAERFLTSELGDRLIPRFLKWLV